MASHSQQKRRLASCVLIQFFVMASLIAFSAAHASQNTEPMPAPSGVAPKTAEAPGAQVVSFPSGTLTLQGVLYAPRGPGPFPAVLFNHGSAAGMLSKEAFDALGPEFVRRGWLFFGPYRRGQGLSASAGAYIGDQIAEAKKKGGIAAGAAIMVHELETDHLQDQLAALAWLRKQIFVDPARIAVAGNSFGGVEAVLGAEQGDYCAAIDSAGGAQSWTLAPELQKVMTRAVRNSKVPIFFFQAANDYNLAPTKTLSLVMKQAGKPYLAKVFPAYGDSADEGHTLGYFGAAVWMDDAMRFLGEHCPARIPANH
jgi:carboxymethylenebutenolidase